MKSPLTATEQKRFHALAVKEALSNITATELAELEKLDRKRTKPTAKEIALTRKADAKINSILAKLEALGVLIR